MRTNIHRNERILNLLAYLMKLDMVVPFDEIRANVDGYNDSRTNADTVARRFERDKTVLRDLGIALEYKFDSLLGVWGYVLPKRSSHLGGVDLSQDEVQLLMALGTFAAKSEGPLADNLAVACQKLLAQSTLNILGGELTNVHFFVMPDEAAAGGLSANLQLLALAVEKARRVEFSYYSIARDVTGTRRVEPYGLKFSRGQWYLVGRCLDAGEIRVFRLDRLRSAADFIEADGAAEYSIPEDFSVDDYVGLGPWELSSSKPTKVTLELDESATWLVEETEGRLSLKKSANGTSLAEVLVSDERGFYRWLLTFGTHVRILAPRAIIDGYLDFVGQVRSAWP